MEDEVKIHGFFVLLMVEVLGGGIKTWKTFSYNLFTRLIPFNFNLFLLPIVIILFLM
jgi:hypothetical protein